MPLVDAHGAGVRDFEVRGVLRVRAHAGGAGDLAAVARDLGPPVEATGEPPDLIVHFVDDLSAGRLRVLEGGAMGYGEDGSYLFDSSGRTPIARVSRGARWGEARIVSRRGLKRIPFLSASLDLATLRRGWVPLHGSGWLTKEGVGVLATGPAGSGKTGALLAACEAGASLVGDDRVLLSADGSLMMGLGRPIVVKDWHLAQLRLPGLGVGRVRRTLARVCLGLAGNLEPSGSRPARWSARAMRRLRRELSLEVDPRALSGSLAPHRLGRPDVLIVLETHRSPRVTSQPIDQLTAASRIAAQVEAELEPALRAHASLEDDRPGRGWGDVERAPEMAANVLKRATQSIPAFLVRHPHPCSLTRLEEVIDATKRRSLPQPMGS